MRSDALAILVCGALGLFACDSGEEPTPVSTFEPEEPFARQILGRVLQGTDAVEGALVRVDAAPGLASDALLDAQSDLPRTASTDPTGFYRIRFSPFIYDLSVRRDREVFVMRRAATRQLDPQLGADQPITGFRARVVPATDPPPNPGNAVAYLVSGADARTIAAEPEASGSLDVTFRAFDTTVRLHAIEYVASEGLKSAVREGAVDVRVTDGASSAPRVAMNDVVTRKVVAFEATLPEGFTPPSLEVEIDFGLRTSAAVIAKPSLGAPIAIAIVPGAAYTVRGRATSGSAVSYSGRFVFDPKVANISLLFPPPVSAEAPIDDAAPTPGPTPAPLDPGGVLAVRLEEGVVEHVLTPKVGDGPVIRVATAERTTTLPDVTRMGLPRPVGAYAWTIEHFPTLAHIEWLSGTDGRVVPPSWKSAPRDIVLR